MSNPLLRSFALGTVLCWAAIPLCGQALQLADGKVLMATVEDADGEGLRVRRLDNGGMLELRWDHLSPASALAVKRRYDLVGDAQDELLVRADEVEYLVNGSKQTEIGKIVDRTATHLVLQKKGVPLPIPRSELQSVRQVDVPVTQVFTKDEFYADALARLKPGDSADKHVLLAEDLVKMRDYDRATEHVQKAKDLGNSRDTARVDAMLVKLLKYKEAAKERELLDQIQAARSRGQLADFEKGGKLVLQFDKDFPQTKLKAEFELEKKRFDEARTRFLSQQVADQFRRAIQTLAARKVTEEGLTLQAARDYAENKMTDDLVARVSQVLRLDPKETKELWTGRAKYPVGKRTEHFAYGLGTWILGDAAILKGTEVGKMKEQQGKGPAQADPNDRDVQRIAKALQQALERRRAAGQGPGGAAGGQQEQTDEDWWREASPTEKAGWLRAYYAEFGGQLVVTFASLSPCISCYGEGTTPEMGGDGKMVRMKCFLCHNTKWLRSFKAY